MFNKGSPGVGAAFVVYLWGCGGPSDERQEQRFFMVVFMEEPSVENNEATPAPIATPVAPSGTAALPPSDGAAPPALYDPSVAAWLSLLFSPIFGGWCCRHNYLALGLPDKAKRSQTWMILGVGYLLLEMFVPSVWKWWLFFLAAWYCCDGRQQAQYLKENDVAYEKKSWRMPLLVAIGATMGLLLWSLAWGWFFGAQPTIWGQDASANCIASQTAAICLCREARSQRDIGI